MSEYKFTIITDARRNTFGKYDLGVGDVMDVNGFRVVVVEVSELQPRSCSICAFNGGNGKKLSSIEGYMMCNLCACTALDRKDEKEVYFMEVKEENNDES